MDELIGFIVEAIIAGMKRREKRRSPGISFDEAQRRHALAVQMQALQQQAIAAKRRVPARLVAAQSRATARAARGTPRPPPLPARAVAKVAPPVRPLVRAAPAPSLTASRVPLQVPLIMGEILGPPLALREPEF